MFTLRQMDDSFRKLRESQPDNRRDQQASVESYSKELGAWSTFLCRGREQRRTAERIVHFLVERSCKTSVK